MVSFAVSHLSLTLGHAESKGRTWQPGKLSLPILLLQIRAQLHRSSCASLVCAAESPSSGGFGEERTFNEGFASSGFFLCFEEHPAQLCTLSLCLPFLCKVSLFKHGTSEGHLSIPSSVIPPHPCPLCFLVLLPSGAARWERGQGALRASSNFYHFQALSFPRLGSHSGAEALAPWQVTAAPSQPCRPCQAAGGTQVPPDWSGCCQRDPGPASGTWVLPPV